MSATGSFLSLAALCFCAVSQAADVAITMDDFDVHETTMLNASVRNGKILAALAKHHAKAELFPAGKYIQTENDRDLLRAWGKAGHAIGNHTFNHKAFSADVSLSEEEAEVGRCESVLDKTPGYERRFRFPMLAEGDTAEKRDLFRDWLRAQGYELGEVTIDASDWYIDQRMRTRLAKDPHADLSVYRTYYLAHIWDRAQYYDGLSKRVLGHEIKHTLLVHFNLLNALFLDDLLSMFESKGWRIIDARDAFKDPIFQMRPKSLPSGQSLVWALAKQSGQYNSELRYPGEDDRYEKSKMDALGL